MKHLSQPLGIAFNTALQSITQYYCSNAMTYGTTTHAQRDRFFSVLFQCLKQCYACVQWQKIIHWNTHAWRGNGQLTSPFAAFSIRTCTSRINMWSENWSPSVIAAFSPTIPTGVPSSTYKVLFPSVSITGGLSFIGTMTTNVTLLLSMPPSSVTVSYKTKQIKVLKYTTLHTGILVTANTRMT